MIKTMSEIVEYLVSIRYLIENLPMTCKSKAHFRAGTPFILSCSQFLDFI
jgi:hypothetical protein